MSSSTFARVLAFVAAATTSIASGRARADEPASEPDPSCDAAFETAELRLRPSEGRLLEARAALLACAQPSCKPWMVDDCTKRLAEVNERIPSVVFSAVDARGAALYDVRILEGTAVLVGHLDGRAIEMDPGPHELVAERGHVRVAQSVVVVEGKKAQQVVFQLGDVLVPNGSAPSETTVPAQGREAPLQHPWARPLAGGLLGGSLVATGIGAGFFATAVARKSDARCDAQNVCDDAVALESARSSARAATVSFVVGGALAIGGVVTFLTFGRTRVQAASLDRVQVVATW